MKTIKNFKEYLQEYRKSIDSPKSFWAEKAEHFVWKKKWEKVLDWSFETAKIKWFDGACLNITENCLDRHLSENGNKIAIKWISNNINEPSKNITYYKLLRCVNFQNLKNMCKSIEFVFIPMIPALIACLHALELGYSFSELDFQLNLYLIELMMQNVYPRNFDGSFRGEKIIPLKELQTGNENNTFKRYCCKKSSKLKKF